jgi:signal transduction histidine kinase
VGRVRLPLGAKLIIGFGLVAALLAIGYTLGLRALSQSNSRGRELLRLQHLATYEQLVLTDARQLNRAFVYLQSVAPRPNSPVASAFDQTITNDLNTLLCDLPSSACYGIPHQGLRFVDLDRPLAVALDTARQTDFTRWADASGGSHLPWAQALRRSLHFTANFDAQVAALVRATQARAATLVAADHSSFTSSRNLLLGVGAGSIALALVLGLLLSWSVVGPLRRTETRLAEIGSGDFSGELKVANRDEIGSLARRVNQMSDELQRVYAELETASQHKSDFLATMSHELRTPLNAIIGFSEVLHEQMFGELNERQLAYVDDVLEAGRHLLSLINDVLDLAKIEAGRMELELSQVDVPDLLRGAVSMHAEGAGRNNIALALTTEPEQITITADERRLRQIVFNLLSNAVKFTPADGRIDVSARADDGQVQIAVADTGPGIAPADLESIFEEFEQTAAGKQAEGTGLGLPLSRKLAELHGGRLWAESTPGHGSTFHLTLPITQEVS